MKRILLVGCTLILLGSGCGDAYVTGAPSNSTEGGAGVIVSGSGIVTNASMIQDSNAFIGSSGFDASLMTPANSVAR